MSEEINENAEASPEQAGVAESANLGEEFSEEAAGQAGDGARPDLDMLLNISVKVSIEMGAKNMKLKDLLKMGKSSVIELDKMAGDPLDVKANGSLIARGEVVVQEGKYGVRLTEVVSQSERMANVSEG